MTQNARNSREDVSSSGWERGSSVGVLLNEALENLLRAQEDGTIDTQIYSQFQDADDSVLASRVKQSMSSQLALDTTNRFSSVLPEHIANISSASIRTRFLAYGSTIESARQEASAAIRMLVRPAFFQSQTHRERLQKSLQKVSMADLGKIRQYEGDARKFLERTFSGTDAVKTEDLATVENFLSDHSTSLSAFGDDTQQKSVRDLLHKYLSRQDFVAKDQKELLVHLARVTDAGLKKRLLSDLVPVVSMQGLQNLGILSEAWKKPLQRKILNQLIQAGNSGAPEFDTGRVDEYKELLNQGLWDSIARLPFDTSEMLSAIEASGGDTDALAKRLVEHADAQSVLAQFASARDTTFSQTERPATGIKLRSNSEWKFLDSFRQHLTTAARQDGRTRCLKDPNQAHKIEKNAYILIKRRNQSGILEEVAYYQIDEPEVAIDGGPKGSQSDGSDLGMRLKDYSSDTVSVKMAAHGRPPMDRSYEDIQKQLFGGGEVEIISEAEMNDRKDGSPTNADNRVEVAPSDPNEVGSIRELTALLDQKIDKEGAGVVLEKGMAFEVLEQKRSSERDFSQDGLSLWNITAVTDEAIEFVNTAWTNVERMTLSEFAQCCESQKMCRIGKADSFTDFKALAAKHFGGTDWGQIEIHKGKIAVKKSDGELYYVDRLTDKDDQHAEIRLVDVKDGMVTIQRTTEKPKTENGKITEKGKYVEEKEVPYEFLFIYLRNYKATTPQIASNDVEHEHDDDHDHEPHMHGGFWAWYTSNPSVGELIKSFGMGKHAIEHWLETRSELGALRWARRWSRFMPATVLHHLEHELTTKSTGKIDELAKHIEAMPPFKIREEIMHILHDKHASFEHVHAAIVVAMKKGGWHLYWEELQGIRGDWLYFRALCRVYRLPYEKMKKMCIDAAKPQYSANQTEEHAIEFFFKRVQWYKGDATGDRYDEFKHTPTIPSDFLTKYMAWWGEGRTKGKEGGERNAGQRLLAADRAQLCWDKLSTGEYALVSGALMSINYKSHNPKLNGAWWWLVMSWAIGSLHGEMTNVLKNLAEDYWHTFHAVPFIKDPSTAKLYQDTVYAVCEHAGVSSEDMAILDKIKHIREGHYDEHDPLKRSKEQQKAVKNLQWFWERNYDKINPHLQLESGYIRANRDKNPAYDRYYRYLMGNETKKDPGIWWGPQTGWKHVLTKEVSSIGLGVGQFRDAPGSFNNMIRTCAITENKGGMENSYYEGIWEEAMKMLDRLKNPPPDFYPSGSTEDEQKAYVKDLFMQYHEIIFDHIKSTLGVRLAPYDGQDYLIGLKERGFNIYDQTKVWDKENFRRVAEADYVRFIAGTPGPARDAQVAGIAENFRNHVSAARSS